MKDFWAERLKRCADHEIQPNPEDLKKAADRIEELASALRLAIYMRQRQVGYFKDRNNNNLVGAKQAEAKFDKIVQELEL